MKNAFPEVYPELVGSEFIDVGSWTGDRFVPEAELQEQLIPTRQKHLPSLLSVLHKLLQEIQNKRNRIWLRLCPQTSVKTENTQLTTKVLLKRNGPRQFQNLFITTDLKNKTSISKNKCKKIGLFLRYSTNLHNSVFLMIGRKLCWNINRIKF